MITIIDGDTETEVAGEVLDGGLAVTPEGLRDALGWDLKPEGLCRGDVCIPLRNRPGAVVEGMVDLATFAELTGRPLASDLDHRVGVLTDSVADRHAAMRSLEAPEFRLRSLDGDEIALRDFAGRKRLLVAWASW
jgi:hypothetical protein